MINRFPGINGFIQNNIGNRNFYNNLFHIAYSSLILIRPALSSIFSDTSHSKSFMNTSWFQVTRASLHLWIMRDTGYFQSSLIDDIVTT